MIKMSKKLSAFIVGASLVFSLGINSAPAFAGDFPPPPPGFTPTSEDTSVIDRSTSSPSINNGDTPTPGTGGVDCKNGQWNGSECVYVPPANCDDPGQEYIPPKEPIAEIPPEKDKNGNIIKPGVPGVPGDPGQPFRAKGPKCSEFFGQKSSFVESGSAKWSSDQLLWGVEDIIYGPIAVGGSPLKTPRPVASGLPSRGDWGMVSYPSNWPSFEVPLSPIGSHCKNVAIPFTSSFLPTIGYRSPSGFPWRQTVITEYIGGGGWNQGPAQYKTTFEGQWYGDCQFPSVVLHDVDCSISAEDPIVTGPIDYYGKTDSVISTTPVNNVVRSDGLPVPESKDSWLEDSLYDVDKNIKGTKYTQIGQYAKGGSWSWGGIPEAKKLSLVQNCSKDNASSYFNFSSVVNFYGNWATWFKSTHAQCSWISVAGAQKFNNCEKPYMINGATKSLFGPDYGGLDKFHITCPTATSKSQVVDGWASLDYSCAPPTEICIDYVTVPGKTCKAVITGDPDADYTMCSYDKKPTVLNPDGVTEVNGLNNTMDISATGGTWEIDWGNVTPFNVPGTPKDRWTQWWVEGGSSPGKADYKANNTKQPFKGEFNGNRVLMWDNRTDESNQGIDGKWENTLDMHWYTAGKNGSKYTVYQKHGFSYDRNMQMQNLDGSYRNITVTSSMTCKSNEMTFNVLQGRNVTGN